MSNNEDAQDAALVTSSKAKILRGLHKEGDLKDMMEQKIPTILTFLSNR